MINVNFFLTHNFADKISKLGKKSLAKSTFHILDLIRINSRNSQIRDKLYCGKGAREEIYSCALLYDIIRPVCWYDKRENRLSPLRARWATILFNFRDRVRLAFQRDNFSQRLAPDDRARGRGLSLGIPG